MVSGALAEDCHRLPLPLTVCPTCNHGIKPARGWTWVANELLKPGCSILDVPADFHAAHCEHCIVCTPSLIRAFDEEGVDQGEGRCGLIWIGAAHYPTPEDFMEEAATQGVSRRISAVPKGFLLGKTWVLMAHRSAILGPECSDGMVGNAKPQAGVVTAFRPRAIELILRESEVTPERIEKEAKRGVSIVSVPDGDPDHDPKGAKAKQGTLFEEEVRDG